MFNLNLKNSNLEKMIIKAMVKYSIIITLLVLIDYSNGLFIKKYEGNTF